METVELQVPGGRRVSALRLQDLPAEHVLAFMSLPVGVKEHMGVKLFKLALGSNGEDVLAGLTFGELEYLMSEWFLLSGESEAEDPDGRGLGLDWNLIP
jgi:hypothetical protein